MASVVDYLRQQRVAKDQELENLISGVGQYSRNQQVLQSLGQGTPEEQSQGFGDKAKGLLSNVLTAIGAPGRLVQGGILEAIGAPTAEMRRTSGLDEIGKLLSGELNTSASNMGFLKTRPGDNLVTRIGKMAGALAADVATDPTSYISAPSSISRKAASQYLIGAVRKEGFLESVLAKSIKGEGLVDDLLKKAPTNRLAVLQDELKVAADAGTPLDVLETTGRRKLATDQLADQLGTALFTKGRTGLLKELEAITGSRTAALSVFKTFPEEVRGGVILTNILGKPVKNKAGEYVRLTQGDVIPRLGKLAEFGNTVRAGTSVYPGNAATKLFGGQAGAMLAGVKKEALTGAAEAAGKQATRLIDYVDARKALAAKASNKFMIQGRAAAATLTAHQAANVFKGEDRALFDKTFKTYFLSPAVKFDSTVASVSERAGFEAAGKLRSEMNILREEAAKLGLDINILGDPNEWSPLILTPEAAERWKRSGYIPDGVSNYNPEMGRNSHIGFEPDADIAAASGFRDPNNPNIVYYNAAEANKRLYERAIATGATEEKALAEKVFSEDPIQIMQIYGNKIAGAASTKRFVDTLVATGALVKDSPQIRKLLSEWDSAQVLSGLSSVSDDIRRVAQERLDDVKSRLTAMTGDESITEVRARLTKSRTDAINARDTARLRVSELTQQAADASAAVAEATPRISQLKQQLKNYTETMTQSADDLAIRQRAAKNVKERLATASKNVADTRTAEQVIQSLEASATSGAEQAYYRELLGQVGEATDNAASRAQREVATQQQVTQELEQIKAARKAARDQGAQDIERQILQYEQTVTKRNQLLSELSTARAARDEAVKMAKGVERTVGLENIDNIDTMVRDYAEKSAKYENFKRANRITKNTSPEEAAAIEQELATLLASRNDAKTLMRETLKVGKTGFSSVVKEYSDTLMKLADELNTRELQAAMVLTNRTKLSQYIETVRSGARDEETVMKAMGDIVTSYTAIRDIVGREAFDNLTKTQEAILLNSGKKKLRESLIRKELEPSVMISALDDLGYSVVNKSAGKQKLYATSGILDVMNKAYKTLENPSDWQKFFNDYIDPLLLAWKAGITIGRGPGYHLNNIMGGLYMNYLGDVAASKFILADKAVRQINKAVKRIEKLNPELSFLDVQAMAHKEVMLELNKQTINGVGIGDLFEEFTQRGGFNSTELGAVSEQLSRTGMTTAPDMFKRGAVIRPQYSAEASSRGEAIYRSTLDRAFTNKLQRMGNNWAQNSELRLRFSAFMDGFERYDDLGAAMDKVHILHFDYQDLSDAEQWVRRVVPFYTWTRRNVPAQLRAMMLQPGKIQRFLYANQEFKNAFAAEGDESWLNQVLPEYLDTQNGFVSKFKFLDNNVGFSMRLPFEDVNKLFGVHGMPRFKEYAGMLGPVTIPLELATGIDVQTGRAIDTLGKDKIETLGNLIPQLGTAQRALGAAAGVSKVAGLNLPNIGFTEKQENKGVVTALNLLGITPFFGMSATAVSKKSTTGELTRRAKSQSSEIKSVAAENNIDVDWIRKQLKLGRSPEAIASMIQGGLGRIKENPIPEQSKLTADRKRQALEAFQNL